MQETSSHRYGGKLQTAQVSTLTCRNRRFAQTVLARTQPTLDVSCVMRSCSVPKL